MAKLLIDTDMITNGWTLKVTDIYGGKDSIRAFTFDDEHLDYHKAQCEALVSLLNYIQSEVLCYNKHEKYNVVVEIEEMKFGIEVA